MIHVTDPLNVATAYAGDGSTSIRINFTVPTDGDDLVLAWGGHISSSLEWDGEPTAVNISGSPYHMRLLDASEGTGNQDLSLSANAIILPNPTITLAKDVVPNDATPNFLLQVTGFSAEAVIDGGSGSARTVPAGAISFNEMDGTGSLADYSSTVECRDNSDNSIVALDSGGTTSGTVTLVLNQNVTCTFTNTRLTRTLTLVKSLSPTDDDGRFDLQVDGAVIVDEAADTSSSSTTVDVGDVVTVDEVMDDAGSLDNYTSVLACTGDNVSDPGGTTTGDLTVTDGTGDITCTFTNTRITRTLTLVKSLSPTDDSGRFDLQVDGAVIVDEAADTSSSSTTVDVGDVVTVDEVMDDAGSLDNDTSVLACTGDNVSDPGGTTTGDLTVTDGTGDITCTFTNTRITRTLTLVKSLSPTDDSGRFDLQVDGAVIVDEAADTSSSSTTVDVGDVVTVDEVMDDAGSLDNYTSVLACTGDNVSDPGGTTTGDLTVTDGTGDITCTFTNTRITRMLTLVKSLSPTDDSGRFDLQVDGAVIVDEAADTSSSSTTVDVGDVVTVDEVMDDVGSLGDYASTLTCTGDNVSDPGGTTTGDLTVTDGTGDITCTFTNTLGGANLTLAKDVDPDWPASFQLQVTGFDPEEVGDGNSGTTRSVDANTEITFNEADGTDGTTGGLLSDYTTTIECRDDGNVLVALDTDNGTDGGVTLDPNQSVTCTFTNVPDNANLTLAKNVEPDDDGTFQLQVDGFDPEEVGETTPLATTRSVAAFTSISFTEANGTDGTTGVALADYNTTLACEDTDTQQNFILNTNNQTDGSVTLEPNQNVTCTFTNSLDSANLTLRKVLDPVEDVSTFQLTVSGFDPEELGHNESGTTRVVAANAPISISEADGTGQNGGLLDVYLSTLACVDDDNAQTPVTVESNTGTGADVTLTPNQNVTCTFTNEFQALEPPSSDGIIICGLGAVTPLVRAEGIAELVGDILLTCETIPAGAIPDSDGYIEVNITASLNVSITNNRDYNGSFQDDTTDAVLVINENNCGAPTDQGGRMDALGVTTSGFEAGCSPPDSRFQDPQFGVLVTNNRLEWTGVQVPIPGADDAGIPGSPFPEFTTIRLTSMRGNASELGIPDVGTPAFAQIQATVTVNGESAITLNTNEANIGLPLLGLISSLDDDEIASGLQCEDEGGHATLTINEGFPTAFKTIGTPSFTISGSVQVENGYPAPGSGTTGAAGDGGATEGGATQSTHFLLTFHNIPEGVRVGVEDDPDCTEGGLDSDHLELDAVDCDVNGDDCDGASPIDDDDDPLNEAVEVDIAGGSGWIGYEVTDDWTIASEDCDIDIWFAWTPDTENDLPAPGTGQLSVSYAPLSTVGTSTEDDEPVPRFLQGSGSDPENVVNVVRCTSTILFPYVTNQLGYDTGLAISNTTEDWLGTSPQDGACEIHYHGETTGGGAAPPTDPSAVVLAGDQLVWLLSSGNAAMDIDPAAEFQGYVIAVCDFQHGHGYAFITDGFGAIPTLAQGYLALILDVDDESVRALVDGVEALDQ